MTERLSNYPLFRPSLQNGSQSLLGQESVDTEKYTDKIAAVYADGGVAGSSRSTVCGSWAWCHVSGKNVVLDQDSGLLIPTKTWPSITNNYAEYVAAVRALRALPEGWIGHVYLDSNITIGRLTAGWANNGLPPKLVEWGLAAMARLGGTFFHLLDGHPTVADLRQGTGSRGNPVSMHNQWCDQTCTERIRQYQQSLVDKTQVQNGEYFDARTETA